MQYPSSIWQEDACKNDRKNYGKSLRAKTSRSSHTDWKHQTNRPNPIDMLIKSNEGRLEKLIPIRFGRMLRSPFDFMRGAASIMAYDLHKTPVSSIVVQACGDCHLLNFGSYATPERHLVFGLNDFDETLPAPWEWDLKRLAASFVIAGRNKGLPDEKSKKAVIEAMATYQKKMREFSELSIMDMWYQMIDADKILASAPNKKIQAQREKVIEKAQKSTHEFLFPKISHEVAGKIMIKDQPPLIYHEGKGPFSDEKFKDFFSNYFESLSDEKRFILSKYHMADIAVKVVGIGSIGTRCAVALLIGEGKESMFIQIKEGRSSVFEDYAGKSVYSNHGQRIVKGQKLMQSFSDIFLGWTHDASGHSYYFRQLRDMKSSVNIESLDTEGLVSYAQLCGWELARAHAKAGDANMISGYIGSNDKLVNSLTDFAIRYADQNEKDFVQFQKAVQSGKIYVHEDSVY